MGSTFVVARFTEREKLVREKWRMLQPTLDERGRRLWAGAKRMRWVGVVGLLWRVHRAWRSVPSGRTETRLVPARSQATL
jgi:hypothetical protein